MYGAIARMRAKPGMGEQLRAMREEQVGDDVTGMAGMVKFQSSSDENEYWLVVAFESRAAYEANAAAPDQHARFERLRALLDVDPEWHDGSVIDTHGSFQA